jgi:alpha-galactosidase
MTEHTWRLDSDDLACQLELAEGALRWQLTRPDSLPLVSVPLAALHVDGKPLTWQHAQHAATNEHDGTRALTIELTSADASARMSVTVELFDDMPFARTSATLTNMSEAPITVTGAEMLRLALRSDRPATLFHVEQFSWAYRGDFFTPQQFELVAGRTPAEIRMGSYPSHYAQPTSCAWFALRGGRRDQHSDQPIEAPGIVGGIEFNGKSRLLAEHDARHVTLVSTIDALAHVLAPGATFELPACFVGFYEGDWDEAGYVTQRFAEAHIHPPMPDDRYPWLQYNSWKYGQEINEAQQLEVIERCAELGVEMFVVDLGWARQIGDWRPDPVKFPRGLRPLSERAHELGMRFGVHIALAQMNPDAPAAREHPEWLIHTEDDYFGAAPICLGHAPCREWLTGEILRLIDEEGLDYIIQDGEDMVKRCDRADHTHAPGDSNYAGSALGLDMVIETLRRERPHVVLENCEDGGCMLTFRMARLYHTSITVDNIATYATRQGIYGASYPFSPRYSARYMQDDPTPYTLRSAIFGGPLILMHRITDWDEEQMAATRAAAEQYKALRPLIRDAKIIHLLPPRNNLDGAGWGWDAIQALAPDRRRAVVMVYRAQGGPDEHVVRPRGLRAEQRYRVSLADRGTWSEHTGAELAETGVTLALAPFDAETVNIEAV